MRVYRVLHRIACCCARARGYRFHPDVVTFHLPAVMVAALAQYTPRHLRRLVAELKAAGLLAGGPHASKVGLRSLWDGTVWALKVKPGAAVPTVTAEEWKHVWRPDFEAEVKGKRGAAHTMSELLAEQVDEEYIFEVVAQAAVIGVYAEQNPVEPSSADMGEEDGPSSVQEVIYTLGSLPAVHARRRGEVVSQMGAALARHLNDSHSRRWYCGLIWQAWAGYVRGEGSLQTLAAALARLDADLREGAPWRSPGAVLSARLQPA